MDVLGELLLRIRGDSSSATEALNKTKGGLQGILSPANLLKGAVIGAGLAINKMANEVIPLNQALDRTSQMTGVASDELRRLVTSVAQVDRPVQQVVETFEFLAERGIHSAESLGRLTPILDTIADALGSNIPAVAEKADRFLGAFGMTLEDLDEKTAGTIYALEKLTREGLQPMSMVARQFGPQMREMGMDLEETATIMLALDRNTGSSREAITYMRKAMAAADGDLEAFKKAIEETTGPLGEYAAMIDGGTEMLEEHAAINIRHFTLWDKMKHQWTEMKFAMGGYLENMREFGMATAGIVPLMGPMGHGLGRVKQGFVGLKSASLGVIGPWLLVAAAVVGLILVFKHLWENNEEFRERILAIWSRIQAFLIGVWENIKRTAEVIWSALQAFWERWGGAILAVATTVWGLIANTIEAAIEIISGIINFFLAVIRGDWSEAWESIKAVAAAIWTWFSTTVETVFGGLRDFLNRIWESITARLRRFGENVRKIVDWFLQPVKSAVSWVKRLFGLEDAADPPEITVTTRAAPVTTNLAEEFPSFEEGGIVPGSPGQAVPITAHAGELVVPADVVRRIDRMKALSWANKLDIASIEESMSLPKYLRPTVLRSRSEWDANLAGWFRLLLREFNMYGRAREAVPETAGPMFQEAVDWVFSNKSRIASALFELPEIDRRAYIGALLKDFDQRTKDYRAVRAAPEYNTLTKGERGAIVRRYEVERETYNIALRYLGYREAKEPSPVSNLLTRISQTFVGSTSPAVPGISTGDMMHFATGGIVPHLPGGKVLPFVQTALGLVLNKLLNLASAVARGPVSMATEFVDEAAQLLQGILQPRGEPALQTVGAVPPSIPEFRYGGVVPGYPGQPQLVIAHGGERITPADSAVDRVQANNIFNFSFYGDNPLVRGREQETRRLSKVFASELVRDLNSRGVSP